MTQAEVTQVAGISTDTSIPEVEKAMQALTVAQDRVAGLELELEAAKANMATVALSGDVAGITQAAMAIVVILSPDGTQGTLIDAREDVVKAQKAYDNARFDARWSQVASRWDAIRDLIKAQVTPELAKSTLEIGFAGISYVLDGFDNATGVNVSLAKRKVATTAQGALLSGERASRGAAWIKGSERFPSAIEVLRAHGAEHSAAKSFNGILNGVTYPATPEGWVAGKIAYAKDASKLARDLGFAPEETPATPATPEAGTPSQDGTQAPEEAPSA